MGIVILGLLNSTQHIKAVLSPCFSFIRGYTVLLESSENTENIVIANINYLWWEKYVRLCFQ